MLIAGILFAVLAPVLSLYALSFLAARPTNLGVTDGKLAPCPGASNAVCSQADDEVHRIEPLRFSGSPDAAWARLVTAVSGQPRTTVVTADDRYLHAEARSLLFRFADDVEFLLVRDAGMIHVRSAARAGRSDLGVNRRRVETIRAAWNGGQ